MRDLVSKVSSDESSFGVVQWSVSRREADLSYRLTLYTRRQTTFTTSMSGGVFAAAKFTTPMSGGEERFVVCYFRLS